MMNALASPIYQGPRTRSRALRGGLVAQLLAGAWRGSPPQPPNSARELEEIATLLLKSGAGSLAWYMVRDSDLRSAPVADQFHQIYRLHTLEAALHLRALKEVIPFLRGFGVEPLLVKGWEIARRYPELGMRPYCDIDLCVLPDDYASADAALNSPEGRGCNVDLHVGFGKFYDRRTDEVFSRSQLVKLGDLDVRVLGAEDNLRFLCIHLLRHGAVRPLWLCDIAVLLESRTNDFDWDRSLSGSHREADWVACTIGLAHQLLGADVEGTPVARRARNLPSWLVHATLTSWGVPAWSPRQVRGLFRRQTGLLREVPADIRRHWPNPIQATMTLRGPFNQMPRLPFQVGHVISRTTALFSQVLGEVGGALQHRS